MAIKKISEEPKISDTVLLEFITTNEDEIPSDPYKVDSITIYFAERSFISGNTFKIPEDIQGFSNETFPDYFFSANVKKTIGSTSLPAWLSTDLPNAMLTHVLLDENSVSVYGQFTYEWIPEFAREGMYFVCYTWTTALFNKKSSAFQFFLYGDTQQTTVIPTHFTDPEKYDVLCERYLPELYKLKLVDADLSPEVIEKFNGLVGSGLLDIENLANQIPDLQDANAVHENFLPYLAKLFNLKLRTQDQTLWRRQIKNAVPLYKKKGTLNGLKEALAQADITFQNYTQYWQITSPHTYIESFIITDENELTFPLKYTPYAVESTNFRVFVRYAESSDYILLNNDYVLYGGTVINVDDYDTGWVSPTVGYDTGTGATPNNPWLLTNNILADDGVNGGVGINGNNTAIQTNFLGAKTFNLNIPNGATIKGFEFKVQAFESSFGGTIDSKIETIQLIKNGSIVGNNIATLTSLTQSATDYTFGSSSELGGVSWTSSDVNNSDFGFALRCLYTTVGGGGFYSVSVDIAQIKVHYSVESEVGIALPQVQWIGDSLSIDPITLEVGDRFVVQYKYTTVIDQPSESYYQDLDLMDTRDENLITYPPKNWNVRLISADDDMFDVLIPTRHPYNDPVIYGKIRTEIPYSENAYNMEEYNGSTRDTTVPCDINRDFIDTCSACISSKFSVDVEIENLSNDRISEAQKIIEDYTPFHAVLHNINYTGGISDFVLPPVEEIEILGQVVIESLVLSDQNLFSRVITHGLNDPNAIRRNMLATSSVSSSASNGVGQNEAVTIYSTDYNFKSFGIDGDPEDNLLEITTGVNAGFYSLKNFGNHYADLEEIGMSPDNISFPVSSAEFKFNLSNKLLDDSITSLTRDDLFIFYDDNESFRLNGAVAGWTIEVLTGPYAGSYNITETYPNDTLKISGWPTTSDVSNINYNLKDNTSTTIHTSTSGKVDVTNRGLVLSPDAWRTELDLKSGDFFALSAFDTQYKITEFVSDYSFYIIDYTGSSIGVNAGFLYRRMTTDSTGFLTLRGMILTTSTDLESSLGIINGENVLVANPVENDSFKENYLVVINSNYYKIVAWDGEDIYLEGPTLSWGAPATTTASTSSISYTILKYTKEEVDVTSKTSSLDEETETITFERIDRRGLHHINLVTTTTAPLFSLGFHSNNGGFDFVSQNEQISVEIIYDDMEIE